MTCAHASARLAYHPKHKSPTFSVKGGYGRRERGNDFVNILGGILLPIQHVSSPQKAPIRPQHPQHEGILTQVAERSLNVRLVRSADEVNIKQVFPRLARQRA